MKIATLCLLGLSLLSLFGCASNNYVVHQAEYSTWKKDKTMHYRKQTLLLNADTGETWILIYDANSPTKQHLVWEKMPDI